MVSHKLEKPSMHIQHLERGHVTLKTDIIQQVAQEGHDKRIQADQTRGSSGKTITPTSMWSTLIIVETVNT